MSLGVSTPDPPDVYREDRDEVYLEGGSKRADIQEYLAGSENAWEEGFSEWAVDTPLTEDEYDLIVEADLLDEFDFYWDDDAGQVTYSTPEIPEDWERTDRFAAIDSWSTSSAINEELDALGETVAGVLTDYFLAWEEETHVVETFGSQFNGRDEALTDVQDAREE